MKIGMTLSLLCLGGVLAFPVQAALNMKWLEFSPAKHFTQADWDMLRSAARTALTEKANGESVAWRNQATGHYGVLTPISSEEVDGRPCRDLVIRNYAEGLQGGGTYRLCRMQGGEWKLLGGQQGK
jgi:surface antigen